MNCNFYQLKDTQSGNRLCCNIDTAHYKRNYLSVWLYNTAPTDKQKLFWTVLISKRMWKSHLGNNSCIFLVSINSLLLISIFIDCLCLLSASVNKNGLSRAISKWFMNEVFKSCLMCSLVLKKGKLNFRTSYTFLIYAHPCAAIS